MTDNAPQFGIAEYKSASGVEICKSCKQSIAGNYYRVNGALACERCTEQLKAQLPKDNHSAFMGGLLFGAGGAVLGLVLYSAFGIITGIEIGYISLAVGWLVGKAIRKGSGGIGGRRYQIAAVAFTYAAVSMAAVPIGISQAIKAKKAKNQAQVQTSDPANQPSGDGSESQEGTSSPAPSAQKSRTSFGAAIGSLVLLGLASPFLELQDPFHGVIGLVILLVGIRIAWQLTAAPKVDLLGPFTASAPSTVSSS